MDPSAKVTKPAAKWFRLAGTLASRSNQAGRSGSSVKACGNLQRHVPVELRVSGAIHLTHAAFAGLGRDGVGAGSSPVATSDSGLPPCVTKDSRWIGR